MYIFPGNKLANQVGWNWGNARLNDNYYDWGRMGTGINDIELEEI